MSENDTYTLEIKGLEKLLKSLKGKPPVARVGILGDSGRTSSGEGHAPSNAEIGAAHEFGAPSKGLVARSFLRIPLSENLQKYLEKQGAFTKEVMNQVLKEGTVIPWLKKIAITAEGIVAEAFDSNGFGKWAAWKNKNYQNNTGQILVDTQQLRNSITSEVKE